jgi:cell division protein FtsQ
VKHSPAAGSRRGAAAAARACADQPGRESLRCGAPRDDRVANARSAPGEPTRASRALRSVWSATKLASGVLIVIAASVAVAWGAHHYAVTTPRFALRQLEIEGNRRKTDAEVAELAGLEQGTNVFTLDLDNAERRLLDDPWIKQARLTRQLPGLLRVEIVEHEAVALAAIDGRLYLVTATGEPFKQLEKGEQFDLPVVTGVRSAQLKRDRQGQIARIGDALQALRHYARLPMSEVHPAQEVHLTEGGDVVLTVGKAGVTLHLGQGPWKQKLLMAARVTESLRRRGQVPGIVFLDNEAHPERVVVRMR